MERMHKNDQKPAPVRPAADERETKTNGGVAFMSLEAMETLTAVEERLRRAKAEAAMAAKQSVTEARAQGEAMLAEAAKRAAAESSELAKAADERAKTAAAELARQSEQQRESLRSAAKAREAEAVDFVVERIVNG